MKIVSLLVTSHTKDGYMDWSHLVQELTSKARQKKREGRIQATGRRGRRRQQPLDYLKEKREYWKLQEEALDRALWKIRCGSDYGPVVRQATVC